MSRFTTLTSRLAVLPLDNIDTDQIIPARYLKVTDKAGLGQALFADWRYNEDGTPRREFFLNRPEIAGVKILLAGDNFGCGSSREHAPWALVGFGFRAIISTRFADIFRNNALKNGLLPMSVDAPAHSQLMEKVRQMPEIEVNIDLDAQTLTIPGNDAIFFPIDPFSKTCLLEGVDELGYMQKFLDKIIAYEERTEHAL